MKKTLPYIIFCLISGYLFCQKNEREELKKYDSYLVRNLEMGKWKTKSFLKNGLVTVEEVYYRRELRSKWKYFYDGNEKWTIRTFDINQGIINDTIENELLYFQDSLLVKKHSLGAIEIYSDFNEFGKPRIVERTQEFGFLPYKEVFEYDAIGNKTKEMAYSEYLNTKDSLVQEIEINRYRYDSNNNVIEIKREYIPEKTFPIPIIGAPSLFQIEKFRFKYNKDGLWVKKYKTINGIEKLTSKRTLK
ncbi:hypothetical protein CLV90_2108 [Maribacter spongiicola]|uniref:YD repeat-containing protein n=1 Tax=Maribacter spongiicola TaxID=1206753 RepID=A0A4R7K4H8_9FLAO|nr:hypothetical protein [Maribacter spongiicola]TDT45027.1 hypothetical protein CLV90_2108 [Maribacter spongiicola]